MIDHYIFSKVFHLVSASFLAEWFFSFLFTEIKQQFLLKSDFCEISTEMLVCQSFCRVRSLQIVVGPKFKMSVVKPCIALDPKLIISVVKLQKSIFNPYIENKLLHTSWSFFSDSFPFFRPLTTSFSIWANSKSWTWKQSYYIYIKCNFNPCHAEYLYEPWHVFLTNCQQCGILTCVDLGEPVQPPFKLRNSKWCSVSSYTVIEYSSNWQRLWSDCVYAQRRLIWGFAGRTYHIVRNLIHCLICATLLPKFSYY